MVPAVFSSFDGTEKAEGFLARPDRYRHLFDACTQAKSIIPRGAGLTYCNAAAGRGVATISTLAFNRILDFSAETGIVEVEPGIRLGDLFAFSVPRGFLLPIMPGHPSITVGGCIGCGIHGKNQHREGNFENAVEGFSIFHPDHGEQQCSRDANAELFELTVGGFGLTGLITSVRLRLGKLNGNVLKVHRTPVRDLLEAVDLLREGHEADSIYSWHNFNVRGEHFGRGYVYAGQFLSGIAHNELRAKTLTPENRARWPMAFLSTPAMRLAMHGYDWSQRMTAKAKEEALPGAIFPIIGKESYFRLYGRRGFYEYQVIVPFDRWTSFVDRLRQIVAEHGVTIGLASLKLFRGAQRWLRFNATGVCLAIDVPADEAARRFFTALDGLTLDAGGVINLAKDSRVTAAVARKVFPEYDGFREALAARDPRRRMQSSLRERLDV